MIRGRERSWALAAVLTLCASAAQATPYQAPPLTGHIVDTAGLLSAPERLALEQRMEALRARTGFELVALLVNTLDDRPIEDVAYGAFNQWGIGRAGKDNGVLLVIATKERTLRIETGKGVGGALTDLQTHDIIERVIAPPMREGRYAAAVGNGLDAIAAALTGGANANDGSANPSVQTIHLSRQTLLLFGAGMVLFILMLVISSGFRSVMWSVLQFFFLARFLGGGRGGNGGGGGGGYSGGGGHSGGGGSSGGY